jgi:hypothetical protein
MLKQVVRILDVLPSPSSITLKVILLRPLHGAGDRIYLAIFFLFQYSERFISSLLLVEINDIKEN